MNMDHLQGALRCAISVTVTHLSRWRKVWHCNGAMRDILPFETFEKYFAPFSGHMLEFQGYLYPTVEHAYHAQRYEDPAIIEEVLAARSAYLAWEVSQQHKQMQILDWDDRKLEVMEELFRAKLEQHADVHEALVASGEQTIVKHQADRFWGDGLDGLGRNEMGKLWMKLREELR